MSMSKGWRILDIHVDNAPRLLVQARFDAAGYQVALTDLSRIWTENLSKDEICRRASDIGSNVDPAEDDEQFRIFLQKIESALDKGDGTSLKLTRGEQDGSELAFHLSAPLPHPLPTLVWTVHLKRLPDQSIETELVSPLLLLASSLKHQMQHLIEELHDKDRVISKICDRLETSGNDLTIVFPSQANVKLSRKKGQREQLAKHVKGLGDFDEAAWRKSNDREVKVHDIDAGVLHEALEDLPSAIAGRGSGSFQPAWWESLGNGLRDSVRSRRDSTSKVDDERDQQAYTANGNHAQDNEEMQEDDFQRQATPPSLKQQGGHAAVETYESVMTNQEPQAQANEQADGDSTTDDDEDDLDAAPSNRTLPVKASGPAASSTKLGTIGHRPSQQSPSPSKESAPETGAMESKPRSKLGAIGGKTGKSEEPVSLSPEPKAADLPSASKTKKMGAIGGKMVAPPGSAVPVEEAPSPRPLKEDSPRPSRAIAKDATPELRETSQERANKKRDQLKRELEDKAKVPVKKKRKF